MANGVAAPAKRRQTSVPKTGQLGDMRMAKLKRRIVDELVEHGPLCGPELARRLDLPERSMSSPLWDLIDDGRLEVTWDSQLAVIGRRNPSD